MSDQKFCMEHAEHGECSGCEAKRVRALEAALRDALGSFRCTQRIEDYPQDHWSRRACEILGQSTDQPGYIRFTR